MYYNNNNYEEYMRNVLGYNNSNNFNTYPMYYEFDNQNVDCESMYPEIYHQINPIVENCCSRYKNTKLSKEVVDDITEQVFTQYTQTFKMEITKTESSKSTTTVNTSNSKRDEETRSPRNENNLIRDLIRILILRNLFPNRPGRPNPRPPMGPYANYSYSYYYPY